MEVPGLPAVGYSVQSSLCMGHLFCAMVKQQQGHSVMGRLSLGISGALLTHSCHPNN